jgi:alpha-amylase/alpha-mannosidase (GH57 family)
MDKFICIHGHFYQPPRENPWLESIELQDSASPYHDWNERITAECYAPNATARIFNGERRIERIVNNYAKISFNFGPTLLAWLKEKMPEIHEAIVVVDQKASGTIRATARPSPRSITT